MRASITAMGIIVVMYVIESLTLIAPEIEKVGLVSVVHYYDPSELLIHGNLEVLNSIALSIIMIVTVTLAAVHFEKRDIAV